MRQDGSTLFAVLLPKDTTWLMDSQHSARSLATALILGLALWVVACREGPDRAPRGPSDRAFNRAEAHAIQDSLHSVVAPGQFAAILTGDPFNPTAETSQSRLDVKGKVTYSTSASGDGVVVTRFTLHAETESRSRIWIELRQQKDAVDRRTISEIDSLTVEQQDRYPIVVAEVGEGRQRYRSRGGYLTLIGLTEGRLRGRFYFEMRRVGESEENWFELVGVFRMGISPTVPL